MKKDNLVGLAMAGLLTFGVSFSSLHAAPGDNRGGNGGNGHGNNGDISTIVDRIFSHLDADESGTISFDEFLAPKLAKAEEKFAALDANEDELLTLEEIMDSHTPPEDGVDRDALRQCVADALGVELPEPPTAEERFSQADSNGDGFIDWSEYLAAKTENAQTKFNQIDSSADGELNVGEVTSAVAARKDVRMARRQCREELDTVSDLVGD